MSNPLSIQCSIYLLEKLEAHYTVIRATVLGECCPTHVAWLVIEVVDFGGVEDFIYTDVGLASATEVRRQT